ncbi:ATP-binding protein [Streptomyces sp. SP18CS02]|uniref:ATP-binding protein n=1 Tax=Streptomyces sp. SP18CS02 TaxID=3002531 RepID=UPI002E7A9044|nr:ATP-binding protein [Streptomyces sp. SP18CS02]MEE1756205.1 ATP-binding protein [Streptomyces sp. SP18CS02]
MKQSAAKTLGVAALGAAFAATGAGSAAAVGSLPAGTALETVSTALPVAQTAAAQLPGGASEVVTTAQRALGAATEGASLSGLPLATATGLLGGLPVGGSVPSAGLGA